VLDVGCGTGLLGKSLLKRGQFTVDGMDISTESLRQAERSGSYAQVLRHDLQVVPLPVASDTYDAAASVGVLSYIEDAEGLLHDLCRCVRSGGVIAFSQRTDYWEERGFPDLILRLESKGLWSQQHITPPLSYIPGHEDFTDEIKVIHTLCIVT